MTYKPANSLGAYLPPSLNLPTDNMDNLVEAIVEREGKTADILNTKEFGIYDVSENVTAQTWFSAVPQKFRYGFRKVISFGALPNATTKSVAHGISGITMATRIFGTAYDGTNYIPIPYASSASPIEIFIDNVNVNIVTSTDRTAFTICYVVLDYLKN